MKPLLTALLLSLAVGPALAQSVDVSIPTLTFPDSSSETVSQDVITVDN